MAAGQQRKRLASSNLHEHYKGKKKKRLDSSDYILNLRSHVQLQWDDVRERVVAKMEQIGITWKDMAPYVDSVPKLNSGLADVFSFPEELFDLDNLMDVLSHEVWLTCLSESERKLLMQFLPSCAFAEQTVHSLLTGENLHFGNPFVKWSTLLSSSDLHPDVLLHKERQTRVHKKQYYLEINKYHTDMVMVLRMLKEKSETCEDPDKLWSTISSLNDGREGVVVENPNDYPIPKRELPLKMCNHYVDVAKYMSYIKVNKKQFEMVKELKHSGDGIQPKSFSTVLGDIKNFHMYPYESYEDEENNKLQEHWMQVTKDTPVAFDKYNNKKIMKMQQLKCLEKELAESRALRNDKAELVPGNSPEEHLEFDIETEHDSIVVTDEDSGPSFNPTHDHRVEGIPSLNSHREPNSSFSEKVTANVHTLKPVTDIPSPSAYSKLFLPVFPLSSHAYQHVNDLSQYGLQFLMGERPVVDKNICNNSRYDFVNNSRCSLQSSAAADGFDRQNWFPNGWSGNGGDSGSADGSLFSALAEYGGFPCRSSFDTNSGLEQLSQLADPYIIPTQLSSSFTGHDVDELVASEPMSSTICEEAPFMRHWRQ